MSLGDKVRDKIVDRISNNMAVPGAEPAMALGMLLGPLPTELRYWRTFFRGIMVALLAYGLLHLQPTRVEGFAFIAMTLGVLSCMTLTRWLSVAGLGLLLLIAIVPQGFIMSLLVMR